MKNTPKNRLYIISFGDSRKYRLLYDPATGSAKGALEPFVDYEKELNEYLAKEFPGDTYAYYTTPRVTEIEESMVSEYDDYPLFDRRAMEEVKRELVREIQVMNDNRERNSNDAWG